MARQCLWASQWGRCRGRPGWAGPVLLAKRSPVDVDEAAVHAQASRRRSGKGCSAGTPPSRPCDRPRDRLHDRPWAQVLRRPRGSCSGRVRLLWRVGTPGGRALLGPGGQPSAPGDAARWATPRRVLDLAVGVSGTGHRRSLIWAPPSGTASHLPPSPGQEGALPTTQPSAPAWPTPRVLGGRAPGDTPWDTANRPSEDATAHTTAPRLISPRPMKGSAPASGIRGTACAAVQSKGAFWEGYAMQVSAAGPEGWA